MCPAVKLARIATLLGQTYGSCPPLRRRDNPLSTLIHTILSQNTNDASSDRAYAALRQRFPGWEEALRALLRTVSSTIRSGGLANIKAVRIKALLEEIWAEQGHLDLSFLRDLSDEEVREYLARFKGIGRKFIACVLLFGMGRSSRWTPTYFASPAASASWMAGRRPRRRRSSWNLASRRAIATHPPPSLGPTRAPGLQGPAPLVRGMRVGPGVRVRPRLSHEASPPPVTLHTLGREARQAYSGLQRRAGARAGHFTTA